MGSLSDKTLFQAYKQAKTLKLSEEFIMLINQELKKRGLEYNLKNQ